MTTQYGCYILVSAPLKHFDGGDKSLMQLCTQSFVPVLVNV